jgi:hypothetical protein
MPPKVKKPSIAEEIRAREKEQRISVKAHEIWEKRGKTGTPEENWDAAIKALQQQSLLQPLSKFWRWTGIPEKKGWDVVQLLVGVSIPIVLFVGGQYFTSQNSDKQQQLADDKAKQDTLVKYLDQMAESLGKGLLKAKPSDDQFIVAQSRTVLTLQSLDRKRQHLIIQFLQASGLNQVRDKTRPYKEGEVILRDGDLFVLYQAQMSKANLANSDLSGAMMIGANLESANLGCTPPNSKARNQCSDLSFANLSDANLSDANLYTANLSDANLSDANLNGADLVDANLYRAYLVYAKLDGADLRGADLRGAFLNGAHLRGAFLNGARLNHANLNGAHLSNANLNGADLSNADLSSAELNSADLNSAKLLATDLRRVRGFTQQQLEGENPPLLCNVALPKSITVNKDRDCDLLPQELLKRFPEIFKTLDNAKQHVNELRKKKWE